MYNLKAIGLGIIARSDNGWIPQNSDKGWISGAQERPNEARLNVDMGTCI